MQQLTPNGQQIVSQISQKYGFSSDAVTHLLFSVINGGGTMAQFSHPELGGSGQWMQGGMLMIGDMFNNNLKCNVDALCYELSNIVSSQPDLQNRGSFQSQSQGSDTQQQGNFSGSSFLVKPDPAQQWYPKELGSPNTSGSQNNLKYAYFSSSNRLAVQTNGSVWIYDTLNYHINGVSQQQGNGNSISFSGPSGDIILSQLPVVSINGVEQQAQPSNFNNPTEQQSGNSSEIFSNISQLADLRDKGILSEQEFNDKKAKLLARL